MWPRYIAKLDDVRAQPLVESLQSPGLPLDSQRRQRPLVGQRRPPLSAGGQHLCEGAECAPASVWVKADRLHPLIPRHTERSRRLYSSRGAVEREFGRLKHEWALLPLRVRGLDRVRLHVDLTILAKLGSALGRVRASGPTSSQGLQAA